MNAVEVLANLRDRGFHIDAAGNKLLVTPASRLTDADRAAIRSSLRGLVELLEEDRLDWTEERAGILEFEAGMLRAEAEEMARQLFETLRQRTRGAPA